MGLAAHCCALLQVWLLNEYRHWTDNAADQVGPRRLGVGGLTISAPELAGANFSAELDMDRAEARVRLGALNLRVLLGEVAARGSAAFGLRPDASCLSGRTTPRFAHDK